jgi:hypothetical protein
MTGAIYEDKSVAFPENRYLRVVDVMVRQDRGPKDHDLRRSNRPAGYAGIVDR